MKSKLFVCSLLSIVGVALTAVPAAAFFGLFHKHGHRHRTVIVCRPYNAFTPVCSGNLICDGCCPLGGGHMDGCGHGGCAHGGILGHDMHALSGPLGGLPVGAAPFTPHPSTYVGAPMPAPGYYPTHAVPNVPNYQPQQQPVPNTQTYAPMNQGYPVRPANFQHQNPVFYPIYPMQQAPSYWYGN